MQIDNYPSYGYIYTRTQCFSLIIHVHTQPQRLYIYTKFPFLYLCIYNVTHSHTCTFSKRMQIDDGTAWLLYIYIAIVDSLLTQLQAIWNEVVRHTNLRNVYPYPHPSAHSRCAQYSQAETRSRHVLVTRPAVLTPDEIYIHNIPKPCVINKCQ